MSLPLARPRYQETASRALDHLIWGDGGLDTSELDASHYKGCICCTCDTIVWCAHAQILTQEKKREGWRHCCSWQCTKAFIIKNFLPLGFALSIIWMLVWPWPGEQLDKLRVLP